MTMKKQGAMIGCVATLLGAGCAGVAGDGSATSALNVAPAEVDQITFNLHANPKFVNCLAQYPGDSSRQPWVQATVARGWQNDTLTLTGKNIKPGLSFDMFTIEHSALRADGSPDPAFGNFGLAWYQSDLETSNQGQVQVQIKTILLDQIFGFDPEVSLAPRQTLHIGFWFSDPKDAQACGFDVSKPTPFNGEHKAGPLAMISVPDANTHLGPLCTKPDTSTNPAHCSP